jgi:hypothetical protein
VEKEAKSVFALIYHEKRLSQYPKTLARVLVCKLQLFEIGKDVIKPIKGFLAQKFSVLVIYRSPPNEQVENFKDLDM